MEDYFGVPVLEAYGMTEASHQMASNPLPPAARKPGTRGPRHGHRHPHHGRGRAARLPPGEAGEVCIHGPTVIREYENNPEATAKSFFGEWFRTGDQGVLDEEGYLRLTGRLKELINRGGEKIAPREIDEVAAGAPGRERSGVLRHAARRPGAKRWPPPWCCARTPPPATPP